MVAGINYLRLLWNLYRQKRNAGRTKEQIERLQKKKLEKLLLFAYEYSPYYRKAFEAEGIFPENSRTTPLENFPVLEKGILMEHFDELVTDRGLKQEELLQFDENSEDDGETYLGKYRVIHSSGSTGTPDILYTIMPHGNDRIIPSSVKVIFRLLWINNCFPNSSSMSFNCLDRVGCERCWEYTKVGYFDYTEEFKAAVENNSVLEGWGNKIVLINSAK